MKKLSKDLKDGEHVDLEVYGMELYDNDSDRAMAINTMAVVDGDPNLTVDRLGVMVHFEEHVSLCVPLDYEFEVVEPEA